MSRTAQLRRESSEPTPSSRADNSPPPTIDPKYLNFPLEGYSAQHRLQSIHAEWSKVDQAVASGLQKLIEAAVDFEEGRDMPLEGDNEHGDFDSQEAINQRNKEIDETIASIDSNVREIIDLKSHVKCHQDQLREPIASLPAPLQLSGPAVDIFTQEAQRRVTDWNNKSAKAKYATNKDYESFRSQLWEVHHEGEEMPFLGSSELFKGSKSLGGDDGLSQTVRETGTNEEVVAAAAEEEQEEDDDEMMIGSAAESFICQLTLRPMKNPLRSKKCHHIFSREGIEDYFAQAIRTQPNHTTTNNQNSDTTTTSLRCPTTGCSILHLFSDFEFDNAFARRVKAWQRREEERANNPRNRNRQVVLDEEEDDDDDDDDDGNIDENAADENIHIKPEAV